MLPVLILAACQAGNPYPGTSPGGPTSLSPSLLEARKAVWEGRPDEAHAAFVAAARESPSILEAWEGAVATAAGPAQREELRRGLESVIARDPGASSLPYRTLGLLLETDTGARERDLYRLRDRFSDSTLRGWAWAGLGITFHERGNAAAALDAFDRALDVTPDIPMALRTRARIQQGMGHTERAVTSLERYLELRPGDPQALYNLAWLHLNERHAPRDARPYLMRARTLLPDDPCILVAVGATALLQDPPDPDTAQEVLEEARRSDPEDPLVHWNLGVLYADHLQRPRDAARHFRNYLETGGTHRERVERWIRELEGRNP